MNSVMRLQREGNRRSKTNQKKIDAAKEVSEALVAKILPLIREDEWKKVGALRMFELTELDSQLLAYAIASIFGSAPMLVTGFPLHEAIPVTQTLTTVQCFATDIHGGLLKIVERGIANRKRKHS